MRTAVLYNGMSSGKYEEIKKHIYIHKYIYKIKTLIEIAKGNFKNTLIQ